MGTSALPDMYTRSPRAAGPVITNKLHFKNLPKS